MTDNKINFDREKLQRPCDEDQELCQGYLEALSAYQKHYWSVLKWEIG